jgi:hypothetical protein
MSPRQSNDSCGRPVAPKHRPEKEINVNTDTKLVAANPKLALRSKTRKAARPSARSSRAAASKAEKLVCRYCGSDDLAPSFKKRRDARCRACFKKRYGSAARGKRSARTRKAKAKK